MNKFKLLAGFLGFLITSFAFTQEIHHNLHVQLNIDGQSIRVIDTITVPEEMLKQRDMLFFLLNSNLVAASTDPTLPVTLSDGMDTGQGFARYNIGSTWKGPGDLVIPVAYSGQIVNEISSGADEYARGFSETSGIISDAGVYLAGASYWVPAFGSGLITFDLSVTLPANWNVVSQGERITNKVQGDRRTVQYRAGHPTEEVYLISAAWTEYGQKAGEVLVQAFLRTPDSALAARYLDATARYLDMFTGLIGPYPYSKFALVENFWETGFGMPSFTLLGEKIIRFPWILSTSYPHELLHNWWGNSVYVDFDKGNWCEGLTAYMADHLLKEQTGQGAGYRRTTLQKFTDYVNIENDFPVIEFRSRNNSAEEAIGYGKCLMFNHMLRNTVGDETYIEAYRSFYRDNLYRVATFDDIQASFQKLSEEDMQPFFDQWLRRKGAPVLHLSDVKVEAAVAGGFDLHFGLSQLQEEAPYFLKVPVAVYFEDSVALLEVISAARSAAFSLSFPRPPVKLEVDPFFDVFRRLDHAEVPPSLSQVFGSQETLIILPRTSPWLKEYQTLAETWKQTQEAQGKSLNVVMDVELDHIPANSSAWIIGFENKFASVFNILKEYPHSFDSAQTKLFHTLATDGALVYTIPNPGQSAFTLGFVGANGKEAVPGLARLLPHYGKYSYLGFEGDRPDNVLKGNFPAVRSPLFFSIPHAGESKQSNAVLEPAKALVDL